MQTARRCLGQMATLLRTTATTHLQTTGHSLPTSFPLTPMATPLTVQQVRTVKDKHVLKLRCSSCHFRKIDERWWVLCDAHPRHKQRERIDDKRSRWIITHVTRGGRPFQKKTEAYVCNTAPPGPYDYKPKIWPDSQPAFPKLKKSDYYC